MKYKLGIIANQKKELQKRLDEFSSSLFVYCP